MYKTFADMEKEKLRAVHQKEKVAPSRAIASSHVSAKLKRG